MDRYPPIPPSLWTDEQRRYAQPMLDGPRGAVISPFVPMMRSPELMDKTQAVGEYLRYRASIGFKLTELTILVTARYWDQKVEWAIHAPIALEAGVAREIIEDLAANRRPIFSEESEQAVHDVTLALLRDHQLPDALHNRAAALFGDQGVIDLFGVIGYYSMLSVMMTGAQTAVPETDAPELLPKA